MFNAICLLGLEDIGEQSDSLVELSHGHSLLDLASAGVCLLEVCCLFASLIDLSASTIALARLMIRSLSAEEQKRRE